MRKIIRLLLSSLFLIALNGLAADCPLNLQIADTLKKTLCIDKFPIGNTVPNGYDKKLNDIVKNFKCFSLAVSTDSKCEAVGVSNKWDAHCGNVKAGIQRNEDALGQCQRSGCACKLVIDTSVIIDANLFYSKTLEANLEDKPQSNEDKKNSNSKSNNSEAKLDLPKQTDKKQQTGFSINVETTGPDSSGLVVIQIQANADTRSLKINDEELGGKIGGKYTVKKIVRVGQETKFTFTGTDIGGNFDSKTISVTRQAADSKAVFTQLNAANVKQQPARDAIAIIIGIEKYKRVAKADFANADAQDFYDYASRALGIKPEDIKLLVDDGADDVEIYRTFQNWLPLKVKKGKTDVFVFFSGHGLPSQDGKSLVLLPWGVDKDFVDKTAINQQEIISALQAVQPKSVTMFIDSCYSGQTRSGDTLLASARPISLKVSETSYPANFTVISASAPDQLSSSSPELKHGIFSYYLMKGMEGDADLNKDGRITVAEMQEYLSDMVGRQAMGMNRKQQPQLFGDPDRILVGR